MSKEDLIVSLGLEDKGVAKQITEINKELKYLDKEFKTTSSTSKDFESTSEGLTKKLGYLEKAYEANKLKLEAYNKKADETREAIAKKEEELKKLTSAEEVDAKAVEKCTNQLNSMKDGLRDTERNISLTEAELTRLSSELGNTQSKLEALKVEDTGKKFKELGEQLTKVGENLKTVGNNISGFGSKLSLAVTTPLVAIGTLCVNAAKNLTEMQRKSEVVFGDMTQDVADWAMKNERAFGLGSGTIQGMATDLADLTQGLGQTKEASIEMAKGATELAVQLGNWGNVAPTDAMEDLKSALSGSHKAMEKYGVKLNDTVLSEQARAMGLGDSFSALDEATKAEVRYQAIIGASSNAINFWNEGNRNMSYYLTEAKEQLGNVSENIGMVLLPAVLEITKRIADLTAKLAEWSAKNPELVEAIVKIAGVVALIGPSLIFFGKLITSVGAITGLFGKLSTKVGKAGGMIKYITGLFSPLNLTILAIIAVVAALALAWATNFGGIREKTKEIFENIKNIISSVMEGIKYAWENDLGGIKTIATTIFNSIEVIFSTVLDVILGITNVFTKALQGDWEGCFNGISNIVNTILSSIKIVVHNVLDAISNIFNVDLSAIKFIVNTTFDNIKLIFSSVLTAIKGIVSAFTSILKGDWKGALDALYNAGSQIWSNIKTLFSNSLNALITSIKNIGSSMYNAGRNMLSSLWDGCKSLWNSISTWFSEKTRWISDIFSGFNNKKNQMASYSGPSTYSLGEQVQSLRAFNIDTTGLDNIALSGSYYNANTMQSRELVGATSVIGSNKFKSSTDSLLEGILTSLSNQDSTSSINASISIDNITIKNDDDYKTMAKKLVNELNIELQKLKNTNKKVKGGKIYA